MRILITNDDGYGAEGIEKLYAHLIADHEVWIIVPDRERSATSHSITLYDILRINDLGKLKYSCTGFPADCVNLGLQTVMKDSLPDLVISGINRGSNLGQDVYYSGTAAGAREASFWGIPSISLSLDVARGDKAYYENIFPALDRIIDEKIYNDIPDYCSLNINAPNTEIAPIGWKYCEIGFAKYKGRVSRSLDPKGQEYYWLGSGNRLIEPMHGKMDVYWVDQGEVSVSPCRWIPNKENDFGLVSKKLESSLGSKAI